MDVHHEVLAAQHYTEGLQGLCNSDEALSLTGFQLMLLLQPLVDRLRQVEAILAQQA